MADSVNIFNPFWTFFFIFFLFYNIFFLFHHFSFHTEEKKAPPFIPQKQVIDPKQGPRVATKTSELPDYGQQLIANSPDIIPKPPQGQTTGQTLPATAYI
tara:strand:- start:4869 stop:5168 length:300 start_codon:yes stop_codon:yes gene_type:complete